jgi:predicted dehydrogenase
MGKEYCKVLKAQNVGFAVVCRSEASADRFADEMGIRPFPGGIEKAESALKEAPQYAIVAVNVDQLANTVISLIRHGIKEILVEKPAGLNRADIEKVRCIAAEAQAYVYVAYNRRFYTSTEKALEIIAQDGGVSSVNFEFTEWGYTIEQTDHPAEVKENWLLANSSHVIDLAFFFGGEPTEMSSYHAGSLSWHSRASKYAGAGVTDKGALFSYQANWDAPGRWAVEVLTSAHRMYFRPMEKLSIQNKGSVKVEDVPLDDQLDIDFKPGLYKQVQAFLSDKKDPRLLTIADQVKHLVFFEKIEGLKT